MRINNSRDKNASIELGDNLQVDCEFDVRYMHRLRITQNVFTDNSDVLLQLLESPPGKRPKVVIFVDSNLVKANSRILDDIAAFKKKYGDHVDMVGDVQIIPGGEVVKSNHRHIELILRMIDTLHICRRSYIVGIGGGAVLDTVGFAAGMAHRGVRFIRIATTSMAHGDSAMAVKNGMNAFEKKNYLGNFAVPWAIINDEAMLKSLSLEDWISGFSECVKVALLKDKSLFKALQENASSIASRNIDVGVPLLRRSGMIHFDHITKGGDPFEAKAARPLDFGHWAAHKLEQMCAFKLPHGHAVAIGLAIDVTYANLMGFLSDHEHQQTLACLKSLGFVLYLEEMRHVTEMISGLEEFREHLGGELTIPMISAIGECFDITEINTEKMREAINYLQTTSTYN